MSLFQIGSSSQAAQIKVKSFLVAHSLQALEEKHLGTLWGIRIFASEFTTGDSLGG